MQDVLFKITKLVPISDSTGRASIFWRKYFNRPLNRGKKLYLFVFIFFHLPLYSFFCSLVTQPGKPIISVTRYLGHWLLKLVLCICFHLFRSPTVFFYLFSSAYSISFFTSSNHACAYSFLSRFLQLQVLCS